MQVVEEGETGVGGRSLGEDIAAESSDASGDRLVCGMIEVMVGSTYSWVPRPWARMECWRKGSRARRPTKVVVPAGEDLFTPRLMLSRGILTGDGTGVKR